MPGAAQGTTDRVHRKTGKEEALRVQIRLLGTFEISMGDRTITSDAWRLQKSAALVKLLALAPGHRLHRDQVLDLLWPDLEPGAAANNLHYSLHVTRGLLGPHSSLVLSLKDGILTLRAAGRLHVDVDEFDALADEARRTGDPAICRAALAVYVGDLLPQDLYEDWLAIRREALRSRYLSLLVDFSRLSIAAGDLVGGMEALQRAVRAEPGLEEAHVELMRLYARVGQRQRSLRQYRQLEQALEELGVEPESASRNLYEAIRDGHVPDMPVALPPLARTPVGRHNLPAPISSFVGRDRESDEIKRLLRETRLLTIVGPGGVGKTRLAMKVARDAAASYRDGVWCVKVAPLADPGLVAQAAARTLGLSEQPGQTALTTLVGALASKDMLLVLDNCEHLVASCAQLAETLLSSCPGIQIMATSRDMLGVTGEVIENVAPFAIPEPDSYASVERLLEVDAMRLLVERVRYRQPEFQLTVENAAAAVEICRQVAGIPLAIELAAARAGALSLDQIAARLSDGIALLAGGSRTGEPRHHTLKATLDWSYDLLTPTEQTLFDRLSVFAGGWTLEAAEVIGAGEDHEVGNVLDELSRLVDQSLVVADVMPEGDVRYRMLWPIRQYALQRLAEAGRAEEVRRRHAALFLALAARAEPKLRGPEQVHWLGRLSLERDNFRAALAWYASPDADDHTGLEFAANLWQFWYLRGYLREGREWLQKMLARADDPPALERARARALRGAGILASAQGDYEQAIDFLEEALALYRIQEPEPGSGCGSCLNSLGIIACEQGDYARATSLHDEALALRRRCGDKVDIAASLLNMGFAVNIQGDWRRSRALHEEALALGREEGNTALVALCLHNLGYITLQQNEFNQAVPLLTESLALTSDVGEKRRMASCLEGLGTAALRLDQLVRSARLYGAASALREAIGAPMYPDEQADWERIVGEVRSALGEATFTREWDKGRALPMDEAVAYALHDATHEREMERGQAQPAPDATTSMLSNREREVVDLVALGLTSREIAKQLGITARTVDTHVGKILVKLGLSSRAQAAAWVIRQERLEPERT